MHDDVLFFRRKDREIPDPSPGTLQGNRASACSAGKKHHTNLRNETYIF